MSPYKIMPPRRRLLTNEIVTLLCDGWTVKQICDKFDKKPYHIDEIYHVVMIEAKLPRVKRELVKNKEAVLSNLAKWNSYHDKLMALKIEYLDSLVDLYPD